jgi:amphiphysin
MSSAQLRLAETIDTFYGASDRTSDSAMAANAYKRSVEELDAGIGRELVRGRLIHYLLAHSHPFYLSFFSFSSTQDAPYRTTILDPLGKMNLYFPTINEHITKRNKKVSVVLPSS